jgi:hypothetical protein
MLSQGFDIFGIHIQYWMLLAAVIAAIAISYITRWLKSGPLSWAETIRVCITIWPRNGFNLLEATSLGYRGSRARDKRAFAPRQSNREGPVRMAAAAVVVWSAENLDVIAPRTARLAAFLPAECFFEKRSQ